MRNELVNGKWVNSQFKDDLWYIERKREKVVKQCFSDKTLKLILILKKEEKKKGKIDTLAITNQLTNQLINQELKQE